MKFIIISFIFSSLLYGCQQRKDNFIESAIVQNSTLVQESAIDLTIVGQQKPDFSKENVQINGHTVFKDTKDEVIEKLQLKESVGKEKGFKFYNGENYFLINRDTITYFEINDSKLIINNPNLQLGITEDIIKEKFPNAYKRKTKDYIYYLEMESFSLYDIEDNEIRIYLYEGKVYSISYFMFDNPNDYPDGF